jgi:hypothetical protein
MTNEEETSLLLQKLYKSFANEQAQLIELLCAAHVCARHGTQ